jgi:hemerythrin
MIEWTPALSTGVPVLDEQHKAIFQWLAELESATVDQRTLFGVYVITRLKHYMREHFAAEEAMMKAAGYPNLAEHLAQHAEFRSRLEEIQLKSIGEDISTDTVRFLNHWLTNHIAKTDMAYVPYLKKQQAKT